MVRHRPIQELYSQLRQRMMRETEQFLEEGARNPRLGVRIPRIVVGSGEFSAKFARSFWELALTVTPDIGGERSEKSARKRYKFRLNGSEE